MTALPRILLTLFLVALAAFCIFGFLASFEHASPNAWHAVYLLALLLLTAVTVLIWRRPRNG